MPPEAPVALITGAGLGLGRALAAALAARGWRIAANDLTAIHLDSLLTEIHAAGGQARAYENDVCRKLDLQSLVGNVLDDFGQIDLLVNHASVQPQQALLEMDEWDWRRVTDVILTGTFLATQSVGRVMREQGHGTILNIGPARPEDPAGRAAYLAAKAGVLAFSQAAAAELAAHSIRVFCLETRHPSLEEDLAAALALLA